VYKMTIKSNSFAVLFYSLFFMVFTFRGPHLDDDLVILSHFSKDRDDMLALQLV
jgi:hypothetical protein